MAELKKIIGACFHIIGMILCGFVFLGFLWFNCFDDNLLSLFLGISIFLCIIGAIALESVKVLVIQPRTISFFLLTVLIFSGPVYLVSCIPVCTPGEVRLLRFIAKVISYILLGLFLLGYISEEVFGWFSASPDFSDSDSYYSDTLVKTEHYDKSGKYTGYSETRR